jgi:hypothetical protein
MIAKVKNLYTFADCSNLYHNMMTYIPALTNMVATPDITNLKTEPSGNRRLQNQFFQAYY